MLGEHGDGVPDAGLNIDAAHIAPEDVWVLVTCPASSNVKNASSPSSTMNDSDFGGSRCRCGAMYVPRIITLRNRCGAEIVLQTLSAIDCRPGEWVFYPCHRRTGNNSRIPESIARFGRRSRPRATRLRPARDSLNTRRSIGNTRSSRRPKFSFTIRLPAIISAARSSALVRSRSVIPGRSAADLRLFTFAIYSPMLETVSSACRVSFTDSAGVTHTVSVSASSLYEAAALGIAEFRRCVFAEAMVGPATRLRVAVEAPATTHELTVAKLRAWLDSSGKTPKEQAIKVNLREIIGPNPPATRTPFRR
jgi:hypothetical protein